MRFDLLVELNCHKNCFAANCREKKYVGRLITKSIFDAILERTTSHFKPFPL